MKPIEPGCLAIVLQADSKKIIGKSCRVVDRIIHPFVSRTTGQFVHFKNGWNILVDGRPFARPEKHLLRIDDYDASTEETTSDREVTA